MSKMPIIGIEDPDSIRPDPPEGFHVATADWLNPVLWRGVRETLPIFL
jgi:hypothetical protein